MVERRFAQSVLDVQADRVESDVVGAGRNPLLVQDPGETVQFASDHRLEPRGDPGVLGGLHDDGQQRFPLSIGRDERHGTTADVLGDVIDETDALHVHLSSPWAYLGGPQLQDIVRRHHVRLTLKPYDFQAVVPQTGGIPLKTRPEPRRTYHALELARWRDYLGMPLNLEPAYYPKGAPVDPDWNKYPGWMVIAAQLQGLDAQPLSHALLRALWAEERDTSEAEVRIAVAEENGYDGASLQALEQAAETLAVYRANSAEAIEAGVFGAPTFILNGERFWGQDRLAFLDRALDRLRQSRGG